MIGIPNVACKSWLPEFKITVTLLRKSRLPEAK